MKKIRILVLAMILIISGSHNAFSESNAGVLNQGLLNEEKTFGEILYDLGIIKGSGGGDLKENDEITRQEMVAILNRLTLKDDKFSVPDKTSFKDVPKEHWAYKDIERAYQIGLTSGIGNGYFGLGQKITSNQASLFLVRSLGFDTTDIDYSKASQEIKDQFSLSLETSVSRNRHLKRSQVFELMAKTLNTQPYGHSKKLVELLGYSQNKVEAFKNGLWLSTLLLSDPVSQIRPLLEAEKISLPDLIDQYSDGTKERDDRILLEINRVSQWYDWDKDGMPDWYEIYRNFTDPSNPDTDGDGILDGDWHERREYTYTVEVQGRLLKPYQLDILENHVQQDIKIIQETDDYIDVVILIYPYDKLNDTIVGNPNWQADNLEVLGHMAPGLSNAWDQDFKKDIIALLEDNDIYPDQLDDLELFIRAVNLIERNYVSYDHLIEATEGVATNNNIHMMDWFVAYVDGKVELNQKFLADDYINKEINDHIQEAQEVLTKTTGYPWSRSDIIKTTDPKFMLEKGFHGSCSSTSSFYASVFQALGIPTKVMPIQSVITDTGWQTQNYDGEFKVLKPYTDDVINGFTSDKMKESWMTLVYEDQLGGSSHVLNYVYIGNRWINVDIAGGFVFNRPPMQGRNGNLLVFNKVADYDIANNLQAIAEASFTPDYNYYNHLNKSGNFSDSPANELPNNYRHFQYKNYRITDLYGNHMTPENRQYIDLFDNWDYQKDMVRYLEAFN